MPWRQDSGQPQFAKVLLYVDNGDDLQGLRPVLVSWHDEAARLLLHRIVPGARPDAPTSITATEEYPDETVKRLRPRTWQAAMTEHFTQISLSWYTDSDASAPEVKLRGYRFAPPRHVLLEATVSGAGLVEALPDLVALLKSVANTAEPAYGEIIVNRELRPPAYGPGHGAAPLPR